MKHDISILNLYGNPVPGSPKNLFQEIQERTEKFIVDTNIPWEKYSGMDKHSGSAFILGPTISREKKLSSLFENEKGKKIRQNVFIFGVFPPREGGLVNRLKLERLDEHALSIRDGNEMKKWDDPNYRINEYNSQNDREYEKKIILGRLGFNSWKDLNDSRRLHESRQSLDQMLQNQKKNCFKDFRKCAYAAETAYALLLTYSQSARHEFLQNEPLDRNVFGDMEIIQNALFFGGSVLSDNHKHLGEMAKYCELKYHRKLE